MGICLGNHSVADKLEKVITLLNTNLKECRTILQFLLYHTPVKVAREVRFAHGKSAVEDSTMHVDKILQISCSSSRLFSAQKLTCSVHFRICSMSIFNIKGLDQQQNPHVTVMDFDG